MPDRVHVIVSGQVQGVGYRYATVHQAVALGLNGWVRNLLDGRVEAEFEGAKEALDSMVEWCRTGPRCAEVDAVETAWNAGPARYRDFQITG